MNLSQVLTLLAVALGWFLNEITSFYRLRRDDKRTAGPILTDLLEIRHRLVALGTVKEELGKQLQIPAQGQLQLEQFIRALVPEPPRFFEKYEEAVSALARVDPVRAFRVRGQLSVDPFLAHLRGLVASDQAGSVFWSTFVEPKLLGLFMPHLEELILDVARAHGWLTWWRTRRRLRKPMLSQKEKDLISGVVAEAKKASGVT